MAVLPVLAILCYMVSYNASLKLWRRLYAGTVSANTVAVPIHTIMLRLLSNMLTRDLEHNM
jgi:hypothetical protein